MKYLRVHWRHAFPDEPVLFHIELDDDGWEVRAVDEYADGHIDLSSAVVETGTRFLCPERSPSLEEINADPEFEGVEITRQEFEVVWKRAMEWFDLP